MTHETDIGGLIDRSVAHSLAGNYLEAIKLVESALEHYGADAPAEIHLAGGIAHAMRGSLELARNHFQLANELRPTPVSQYHLGSVLAATGQLMEANRIFCRNLELPLSANETTSTQLLRFYESTFEDTKDYQEPFGRIFHDSASPSDTHYDFVYFVACDPKYLRLFLEALLNSLNDKINLNYCVHVHVVNPTGRDLASLSKLAAESPCDLYCSYEKVSFPSLSESGKKTYYSCARFLAAPAVVAHYDCPIVLADIDQLVVGDVDSFVASIAGNDIGLIRYPQNTHNILSLFSASIITINNTPNARVFLTNLCDYLKRRMRTPRSITWHLDQAAIAVVYFENPEIRYKDIDPCVMHSSLDGSTDIPSDTVFWSITYHVLENDRKLKSRMFESLKSKESVFPVRSFGESGPRISIVIPVFNGANYLKQAIDSALGQTWTNLEIIVVNDGSTDNGATRDIALSYGDTIRYLEKANGGVASALNAGIEAMTGDVFCWLSHDDVFTSNKTEIQVKVWKSLGYEDVVLYSDYELIDAQGKSISLVTMDHALLDAKPVYALFRAAIHGCSIFIPREVLEDSGTFDTFLPTTQDYELWSRMITSVRFFHIPDRLIYSRWHDEQGSKKLDHRREAAEFWSGLLELLPREEQILLEGSQTAFLRKMADFLFANSLDAPAQRAILLAEQVSNEVMVSVVIPVHNRFEMVMSAVRSVVQQTHSNIEIVVVDDGSTDDPRMLDDLLSEFDVRIRILRQERAGFGAARNFGSREAKGEFLAFLDSEDLYFPNKIEIQLEAMLGSQSSMSHTSYWLMHPETLGLELIDSGDQFNGCVYPRINDHCPIGTSTVMINRRMLESGFCFPEQLFYGSEAAAWKQLASESDFFGIGHPLVVVRQTPTDPCDVTVPTSNRGWGNFEN